MGMRPRTDKHTTHTHTHSQTHRCAWSTYISRRLRLTRNVISSKVLNWCVITTDLTSYETMLKILHKWFAVTVIKVKLLSHSFCHILYNLCFILSTPFTNGMISGTRFFGPCPPATQLSVLKYWKKHKAITLTSGLSISLLHPPSDPLYWLSAIPACNDLPFYVNDDDDDDYNNHQQQYNTDDDSNNHSCIIQQSSTSTLALLEYYNWHHRQRNRKCQANI